MQVLTENNQYVYVADTGDWRLLVGNGVFDIQPQVGGYEYSSGINLDNLAALIVAAKAHATANDINWGNN
jgi:hypothetical protein